MSAQTGRVQARVMSQPRSGGIMSKQPAPLASTCCHPIDCPGPACAPRHMPPLLQLCHAAHLRPAAGVKGGTAKARGHSLRPVKQLEAPVVAIQVKHSGAGGSLCGQGRVGWRADRVRVCGASGGGRRPARSDRRQPRRPGRYCHRRERDFSDTRRAPELLRGSPEQSAWSKAWPGAVNDRSGTCGLRLLMPMTDGSSQCRAAPCSDMAGRAPCLGCRWHRRRVGSAVGIGSQWQQGLERCKPG